MRVSWNATSVGMRMRTVAPRVAQGAPLRRLTLLWSHGSYGYSIQHDMVGYAMRHHACLPRGCHEWLSDSPQHVAARNTAASSADAGLEIVRERGSAPKGVAHSTASSARTAGETLESRCLQIVCSWFDNPPPKEAPRSRISRSTSPFSGRRLVIGAITTCARPAL